MQPSIGIIGAGISGLAAGYRLRKAGFSSTILEKESYAGGRTHSEVIGDFVIDTGAYTIPESHKNTLGIIDELGLGKNLRETSNTSSISHKGREYPVKIGSTKDFLTYKLLSLKNKKDLIRIYLYAVSLAKSLDLNRPSERTFELEQESAAEYLLREYDRTILEYIAYPIFSERFLGVPEENSKAAFLAAIKILTITKIFSLEKGMGSLSDRLAELLDVRFRSPVLRVRRSDPQGPYQVDVGGDEPKSLLFDTLIFALPIPILPDLFEDLPLEIKRQCKGVRYAPTVVNALALNRSYPQAAFITNLLREEFQIISTIVSDHHKNSHRHPEGKSLLTIILGEKASRSLFDAPEDFITREVRRELSSMIPGIDREVIFSKLYRWKYGAVQLKPGALHEQRMTRKALKDFFRHVHFVDDGLYHSSIEVQINTGSKAADDVIDAYKGREGSPCRRMKTVESLA